MVSVQPKPSGRWPVAPKTQASGLGAAAGSAVASVVVGLLQQYVTHKALPQADVGAIYLLSASAVAWVSAYLAPHQDRQQPAPEIGWAGPRVSPPGGTVKVQPPAADRPTGGI